MTVKLLGTGAVAVATIGAAAAGMTYVVLSTASTGSTAVAVQPGAVGAPLPSARGGVRPQPLAGTYAQDPPPPAPPGPNPPAPNPAAPAGAQVALPSPDQLASLCTQATDPGVSYTTKTNLVENGISPAEGHVADHDLRKAYRDGKFPESFNVTNIQPAGPNMASADVAISGPKFAGPVTKQLVFVNQGGNWILQHDAALALLQAATA
jgi:hypothetical protein